MVIPKIRTCSERRADCIEPGERLCVTLRHLFTGDSQIRISTYFRIGPITIGDIINETCQAFWDVFIENNYLKTSY